MAAKELRTIKKNIANLVQLSTSCVLNQNSAGDKIYTWHRLFLFSSNLPLQYQPIIILILILILHII